MSAYPDWTRAQICLVARAILDICKKPGPGALDAIASLVHTIEVNTKRDLDGIAKEKEMSAPLTGMRDLTLEVAVKEWRDARKAWLENGCGLPGEIWDRHQAAKARLMQLAEGLGE